MEWDEEESGSQESIYKALVAAHGDVLDSQEPEDEHAFMQLVAIGLSVRQVYPSNF
jgi:hypothetical protein